MMLRPRWQKVLSDLWKNKTRSILIIASIAVGLLAIGIISSLYFELNQDMTRGFQRINPANIQFKTSLVDADFIDHLKKIEGVREVEGARDLTMQVKTAAGNWNTLNIQSKDFSKSTINDISLLQGTWPPQKNQIVLADHKLKDLDVKLGDWITLQNSEGDQFQLQVVGFIQDQMLGTAGGAGGFFAAEAQGYVSKSTLTTLHVAGSDYYNKIYVTVTGDATDESNLETIGTRVYNDLDDNGITIGNYSLRSSLGHPNIDLVNAIVGILFMLTFLIVFLSGFLITNTLQFLLNQQMQQVGIMKSVGATRRQIILIYVALISIFGILAFFLILPLTRMATDKLMIFLAEQINFTYFGPRLNPWVLVIQIILALVVPLAAASAPVLRGTRLSVQEALSGIQQQTGSAEMGKLDHLLANIKGMSRPILLAVRSVFRNKGRLILTLVTLSLGGAVFISVFSVRISFNNYIAQLNRYFLADLNITLAEPERVQEVEQIIRQNAEVKYVEAWSGANASIINPDGSTGDNVNFSAVPNDSDLIKPIIIEGRWLDPRDQNAIALNDQFHARYPDLKVGDTLTLMVNDKKTKFVVVGFYQLAGKLGGLSSYVNLDYFDTLPGQVQNQAAVFRVVAKDKLDASGQKKLASQVQSALEANGYQIGSISTASRINEASSEGFNILTTFLLILAILIALVGSIGLTGTMSMNIMDRTREIGIMRSIGASDRELIRMVIVEGLIIGWLSWILGAALSFPISAVMSNSINEALFGASSRLGFSITGFLIWFIVVSILSVASSITPARSATRLTIREVLSYE